MPEHKSGGEASELSRTMRQLSISGNPTSHADARSRSSVQLPLEIRLEMMGNLPPVQDMIQSYEPGSQTLRSADAGLHALQALCLVSKEMESVARPLLYKTVVVSDPYKLEKLRQTLDRNPYLGLKTTSLGVYWHFDSSDVRCERSLQKGRDPGAMTLSQFSAALVAVLDKTPNLVTLYLNFDKPPPFEDPDPFRLLSDFFRRDISSARGASSPGAFLPNVTTLGIVLPPGGASPLQRSFEYQIFEGLLNLPALRHIVVRRNGCGPFQECEDYTELFSQRNQALRGTIRSVDAKIQRRMRWDDMANIGAIFHALTSLKVSHRGLERSTIRLPPGTSGLPQMEDLLHLSIDIHSQENWLQCQWFSESIKFKFCLAPMLKTLRIPLRLFRDHTQEPYLRLQPGQLPYPMLYPSDVLPETLESLVLVADMTVHPEHDLWDDADAVAVEDEHGSESHYPTLCHMRYSWAIRFLQFLEESAGTYVRGLKMVTLEYEANLLEDPDAEAINSMLINCEVKFVSHLQALQGGFAGRGISFSWTRL